MSRLQAPEAAARGPVSPLHTSKDTSGELVANQTATLRGEKKGRGGTVSHCAENPGGGYTLQGENSHCLEDPRLQLRLQPTLPHV